MTETEARARAEAARAEHAVPREWHASQVEQRFIQLGSEDPAEPAPVRDLLAWIVRFAGALSWIDLALDDRSGDVVRVERSR